MGAGGSIPMSVEAALAKGYAQQQIDDYIAKCKVGCVTKPN